MTSGGESSDLADAPHALDVDEVTDALGVDPDAGLTSDEARRRLRRDGPNRLGETQATPWWRVVWAQISNAVVVLLIGAAAAGFVAGEAVEAIAILVVLVVNTVVGFVTEYRAARSMEALRALVDTIAEVERDDRRDEIDAAGLVVGDVVGVEAGEQVPADMRVIEAEGLRVDEAGLTGENEPVDKTSAAVDAACAAGRPCRHVVHGHHGGGRARSGCGGRHRRTHRGWAASPSWPSRPSRPRRPLQQGLSRLSRRLAIAVVIGAGALLALGVFRGLGLDEAIEIAVALAIAVVPEGLPAVATLTLAVGMRRMAAGNALCVTSPPSRPSARPPSCARTRRAR